MLELKDVTSQQIPVVFAEPEESDIHHWHALIGPLQGPECCRLVRSFGRFASTITRPPCDPCTVGPPSTPYSLGLFHFDMRFPTDYPNTAPKVLITTTAGGLVRFNPNLYATGKVCLSILGTWRAEHSGEQWSAVQSVQSVLLSIQSLLHDKPYHNEPSFEADDGSGDVERYNDKILHETLRVAVCEVLEDTIEGRPISSNGVTPAFAHVRKAFFHMNAERYLSECRRMAERKDVKDGQPFKMCARAAPPL